MPKRTNRTVQVMRKVWTSMKSRCFNKGDKSYKHYGGRGITMCKRWLYFENFFLDMGYRPTNKHSIERINNDGNYEPGNCKWATPYEQSRNQRTNINVQYNGVSMCLTDLSKEINMPFQRLLYRVSKLKLPIEIAINPEKLDRHIPCKHRKFSKETILKIRDLAANGYSRNKLAAMHNVTKGAINSIMWGKTYKDVI